MAFIRSKFNCKSMRVVFFLFFLLSYKIKESHPKASLSIAVSGGQELNSALKLKGKRLKLNKCDCYPGMWCLLAWPEAVLAILSVMQSIIRKLLGSFIIFSTSVCGYMVISTIELLVLQRCSME